MPALASLAFPLAAAPIRFTLTDLVPLGALALVAGLWLFVRGLQAYRAASRVGTIATSPLAGLAAGEVRVSGTVEPAETTLVSPLQSRPCVYYRARVSVDRENSSGVELDDERSVSFVIRDASGTARVFPRGARWDVPEQLDARSGLGETPLEVELNRGAGMELTPDREAQIAALLTVHGAPDPDASLFERTVLGSGGSGAGGGLSLGSDLGMGGGGSRHYQERRLEPGDVVTIVGAAVPFADVGDGVSAPDADPLDDPEIAADLAEAVASGELHARAADAWGNAAIPGFGIGQPTRPPVLDPAATPETVAVEAVQDPAVGIPRGAAGPDRARAPLAIPPDELVIASGATAMAVFAGTPGETVERESFRFWSGLAGAGLAVLGAAALAIGLGAR